MAYKYTYDSEPAYKKPRLNENRSVWKFLLLNLVTLGLYMVICFIPFSYDLDLIAPKRDHSKTTNFLFVYLISYLTLGIVLLIWFHEISARVEDALRENNIQDSFSTSTFWCWCFTGAFIPFLNLVFYHKLFRAMNLLCADYNRKPAV